MRRHFREVHEIYEEKKEATLPYSPYGYGEASRLPREVGAALSEVANLPDEIDIENLDRPIARVMKTNQLIDCIVELRDANQLDDANYIQMFATQIYGGCEATDQYGKIPAFINVRINQAYLANAITEDTRDALTELVYRLNDESNARLRIKDVEHLIDRLCKNELPDDSGEREMIYELPDDSGNR